MTSSQARVPGAALIVACLLPSACATQHVHLVEPPTKTAPYAERVAYYKEHRPVAVRAAPSGQARGVLGSNELAYVILEDGTRVDHVEDLLPTVAPGSPTAQSVTRERAARERTNLWSAASFAAIGVGGIMMIGSVLGIALALPEDPQAPVDDGLAFASLGALVAGGAVTLASTLLLIPLTASSVETMREKETAFLTYDRSLRERLDLVEYGQRQETALVEAPPDRLEDR